MKGGWERLGKADLGIFRVGFAAVMLVMLPDVRWVTSFPDSLYRPPPGPMQLLDGFPSAWILATLEAGIALSLACLLLGRTVRIASWALAAMLLVSYGLHNSLGKIDHSILILLTPVALVLAGWGPDTPVRPWVMKLWAFTIGVAMLTAALPKVIAGLLETDTQAVRGILTEQVFAFDQHGALSGIAVHLSSPLLWEPIDWSAPLLEGSVVVCAVIGLRMFRRVLAVLVSFHLGIGLMLNIWYAGNVLAYGAFVSWAEIPWAVRAAGAVQRAPGWVVVPVTFGAVAFSHLDVDLHAAVVVAGFAVTCYLVSRTLHDRTPRLGSRRDDPLRSSVPRA